MIFLGIDTFSVDIIVARDSVGVGVDVVDDDSVGVGVDVVDDDSVGV